MSEQKEETKVQPIDWKNVKLERGTTPENIKDKCFELCQQYLGGVWLNLTIDEVEVRRLSGGLTNQLYYCAVNEDKQLKNCKVPQEVAIRLYQDKHFNKSDSDADKRLTDTIIALLVSENGLGPQIYGLFEGGQIQKYYKHKYFRDQEQKDSELVNDLWRRLARIHAMDVPLKRTGNWLFQYFDECLNDAKERFDLKALFDESKSITFQKHDINEEIEWLKKVLSSCNSPNTFTHLDFRPQNILITESDGIVLCDFEYSCYGYRGYDFGTILCEWGRKWGEFDQDIPYPSDETLEHFINTYIEESVKLKGKQFSEDNRNCVESMIKEVKLFTLVGRMWIILFLLRINQSIISEIPFNKIQMMETTEKGYKKYHELKHCFIQQNVFNNLGKDYNNN